ncbi:hypothetical protein HDU67_003436 [Dinochytrium kinnereticum]|nr:hypothetical protein HDU67_003436 [Dinochytrium kinnereticum]
MPDVDYTDPSTAAAIWRGVKRRAASPLEGDGDDSLAPIETPIAAKDIQTPHQLPPTSSSTFTFDTDALTESASPGGAEDPFMARGGMAPPPAEDLLTPMPYLRPRRLRYSISQSGGGLDGSQLSLTDSQDSLIPATFPTLQTPTFHVQEADTPDGMGNMPPPPFSRRRRRRLAEPDDGNEDDTGDQHLTVLAPPTLVFSASSMETPDTSRPLTALEKGKNASKSAEDISVQSPPPSLPAPLSFASSIESITPTFPFPDTRDKGKQPVSLDEDDGQVPSQGPSSSIENSPNRAISHLDLEVDVSDVEGGECPEASVPDETEEEEVDVQEEEVEEEEEYVMEKDETMFWRVAPPLEEDELELVDMIMTAVMGSVNVEKSCRPKLLRYGFEEEGAGKVPDEIVVGLPKPRVVRLGVLAIPIGFHGEDRALEFQLEKLIGEN